MLILKKVTFGCLKRVFDAVVKSESLVPIHITRSAYREIIFAALVPVTPTAPTLWL